jgi:hypothetical protein
MKYLSRIILIAMILGCSLCSGQTHKRLRIRGISITPPTPPPPQFPELEDVGGDNIADVGGDQVYAVH